MDDPGHAAQGVEAGLVEDDAGLGGVAPAQGQGAGDRREGEPAPCLVG